MALMFSRGRQSPSAGHVHGRSQFRHGGAATGARSLTSASKARLFPMALAGASLALTPAAGQVVPPATVITPSSP
ncbi:MAG TPA: hypothetical protein VF547_03490, partial [Allosphingosinicella sp.]